MADPVGDFKEMGVWRVAMYITRLIYEETRKLPDDERFGLTSQMRRTAVSIASNIAEGYGRGSRQDYIRFLQIARGAACELETQLLLCQQLGYALDADPILIQLRGWYQLLHRLLSSLRPSPSLPLSLSLSPLLPPYRSRRSRQFPPYRSRRQRSQQCPTYPSSSVSTWRPIVEAGGFITPV